ncbi:MAG: ABC transporter permease [Acutalibacteraceae bacterium]|jgi:putative ABC transport system permease protein
MGDIARQALRTLRRKRARAALTVGGIVVGVAMVAMVALIARAGEGVMDRELDSLGLNGLSVSARGTASDTRLREEHLQALRQLSEVKSAMPLLIVWAPVTLRQVTDNAVLCGVDAGAGQVISLSRLYGRLIAPADVQTAAPVCVVDAALAKAAFHRENVVGQTLSLSLGGVERTFTVVGVSEAGSGLLQNVTGYAPGMVYLPYTVLQQTSGRDYFDQIAVRTADGASSAATGRRIVRLMEQISGYEGIYRADDLSAQKEQIGRLAGIVTLVLTLISGISLLVSGLGIMTAMLSSVNERTREIGIKKALGATRRRIGLEFLAEAMLLSLLGGGIGLLAGGGIALAGLAIAGVWAAPSLGGAAFLMGFCLLTGGAFGAYPAVKASGLPPVDALRAEG